LRFTLINYFCKALIDYDHTGKNSVLYGMRNNQAKGLKKDYFYEENFRIGTDRTKSFVCFCPRRKNGRDIHAR
jgi:hypothetical protein